MLRHARFVRVTHWINTAAVLALVVSGVAMLLAHPRLYWGEAGVAGDRALVDLPLPMLLTGQTGWGRSLHFLAAWLAVLNAIVYIVTGAVEAHFTAGFRGYSPAQRIAYAIAVFGLAPIAVWTGLAMSPSITASLPLLATVLGGHQSARTIHFVAAVAIVAFAAGHVTMVAVSGFVDRVRAMITGRVTPREEQV